MNPSLVLASASPRRAELLERLGLTFTIEPAHIDESHRPGEEPPEFAERLSVEKATAISERYPRSLVVGSDTIVVVDGDILGKPADRDEAIQMLQRLSGRSHTVISGVAVAWGDRVVSTREKVLVEFRSLSPETIESYVATGEPMDKAGAYGIQGFGSAIVDRIEGDYFAVMGLPVGRLLDLFNGLGVRYAFNDGLLASAD